MANQFWAKGFALLAMGMIVMEGSTGFGREADIYPPTKVASGEIRAALAKAKREHKRVILDFGGNWCGDCRSLDKHFHEKPNAALLRHYFILVDVNIGHGDENLDLAKEYGIPISKGVPALAVVGSKGELLYSQRNGEFESMRRMDPSSVTKFLEQWK